MGALLLQLVAVYSPALTDFTGDAAEPSSVHVL